MTTYTLADDGSYVTYGEDQTKKTDYEVGGRTPSCTRARRRPARSACCSRRRAARRSCGRRTESSYAYARDGRVYLGSLADTTTRQIAGPPPAPRGTTDSSAASAGGGGGRGGGRGGRGGVGTASPDRFSVSRFSPKGDALLLSNRDGLWVYDIATQHERHGDRDARLRRHHAARDVRRVERRRLEALLLQGVAHEVGARHRALRSRDQVGARAREGRPLLHQPSPLEGRRAPSFLTVAEGQPARRDLLGGRRSREHAAVGRRQSAARVEALRADGARALHRRRRPLEVRRGSLSGRLPEGQSVSDGLHHLRGFLRRHVGRRRRTFSRRRATSS